MPEIEQTFRELLKESYPRIWWEEEPAPNSVTNVVIEWLESKKANIGNKIYSDHRVVAETIFDELLKELQK